jgi:serpin B
MLYRLIISVAIAAAFFGHVSRAEDPSGNKAPAEKPTTVERIRQALDTRVDFVIDEQPLEEFVEFLRSNYHIPVVMSEADIRKGTNASKLPTLSKSDMRGVRLRTMLSTLLGDQGLDWLIHDEVLWITAGDVASDMLELHVYEVKDLVDVDGSYDFDSLIDLITNVIAPEHWTATGGPGKIERFKVGETPTLVVRNSARIHEQIEEMLKELRALKKDETKRTSSVPPPPQPAQAFTLEDDPKRDAVVVGNTEFALALYDKLRQNKGNVIVSPYNISSALAMAYAGARNETAREMATAMHWPIPKDGVPGEDLHEGFLSLQTSLQALDPAKGYELRSANRIWCRQGLNCEAPFVFTTGHYYGVEPAVHDFGSPKFIPTVNDWTERNTGGQIKNFLRTPLPPNATIILTSAVYFHGKWATPFEARDTRPLRFNFGETLLDVQFMDQKDRHGYAEIDGIQVLEKPYKGNALSMVILLPEERAGALETLESSLSAEKLKKCLAALQTRRVHVQLPRFKFETETDLKGTLMQLGMRRAFASTEADFSGMAKTESSIPIYLDRVLHKATIDVAEEGTKATAATAIVGAFGGMERPPILPVFLANRPFLFLIRDLRTGSILSLGRLAEPESMPMHGFQPATRVLESGK